MTNCDQIILYLPTVKSIWSLLRNYPEFHERWIMIHDNLTSLFRKDTLFNIISNKYYYPKPSSNCRYYIKPNSGSNGKNIQIVNKIPDGPIDGFTIVPEILTPFIKIDDIEYKYDYRVWIGIQKNLKYFICHNFIKRISMVPFAINRTDGSLTNTSIYSNWQYHTDDNMYDKINNIVKDVLSLLTVVNDNEINDDKIMLTGWDFIENQNNDIFLLEVNCDPSISIKHADLVKEFVNNL